MISILTGAKKNLGDYLIGDRAKKLLRKFVDDEIVELDRFKQLDSYLDIINKSRCLVLCGGPAYSANVYPGIYPLVADINKIKVPIVPFGLGWCGKPFKAQGQFTFSSTSFEFLKKIHSNIPYSSCRDNITKGILERHGISNVLMTGCPAWYDLDYINKPFNRTQKVNKIVLTTGANARLFFQTIELVRQIRIKFQEADIYLSFHRGLLPDKQTSIKSSSVYMALALASKLYKTKVVDVSYDLSNIDFYESCDLHIGYRVHAHLYFLSKRLPSILINEDGRGMGMTQTMKLPVFNYDEDLLINNVMRQVDEYISNDFSEFSKTVELIDHNFESMKIFLRSI
jgi:polysaccharide pyruvyl transferase WcaK-like protein